MRRSAPVAAFLLAAGAAACRRGPAGAPDLATAKVVDLTHAFDRETLYWPTSPSAFELKPLADGQTPGGWFYSLQRLLHARARRHASRRPDPLREGRPHGRPDPGAASSSRPPPCSTCAQQAAADPDYRLTVDGREGLGDAPRPDPGRRDRAARDGLERALARPQGLPRRRHARRRLEAPLPVLRRGGRGVPRARAQGRRPRGRHGLDRLRRVAGLRRPPARQRRERPRARERRAPRRAARVGRVGRRAAR